MTRHTISLIALQNLLRGDLELFNEIKPIVTTDPPSNVILSHLYDSACQAHAIGSRSLHDFILRLFLPSLDTYLRPFHAWMTQGHLNTCDYPEFFITSTLNNGHRVFDLVQDNGFTLAPRFMSRVVSRIFAAGKTMDFVNCLNQSSSIDIIPFTPFLHIREFDPLNPLDQAFGIALDAWIMQKYDLASKILRKTLHSRSELWTQLNCVHRIYLMLSHEAMARFTEMLFQKVILLRGSLLICTDESIWRMARSSYSHG